MNILPTKNYTALSTLNQRCLPMDSGVLIPQNDSVRLLAFILKQLDLTLLYEAYTAYCEKWRREQADRECEAVERNAGKPVLADEAEGEETRQDRQAEKKKDGRVPCDIVVS